jgi:sarcosine oxidase delta subunit
MNEITRTCPHCKTQYKLTFARGSVKITIYCPHCSRGGNEIELTTISANGDYEIVKVK